MDVDWGDPWMDGIEAGTWGLVSLPPHSLPPWGPPIPPGSRGLPQPSRSSPRPLQNPQPPPPQARQGSPQPSPWWNRPQPRPLPQTVPVPPQLSQPLPLHGRRCGIRSPGPSASRSRRTGSRAVRPRGCPSRSTRRGWEARSRGRPVDVDGVDFAGDRVVEQVGPRRAGRDRRDQGERERHPWPCTGTHSHSRFIVRWLPPGVSGFKRAEAIPALSCADHANDLSQSTAGTFVGLPIPDPRQGRFAGDPGNGPSRRGPGMVSTGLEIGNRPDRAPSGANPPGVPSVLSAVGD